MAPERTLSQTAQQITQSLVTEKIQTLFGDFEFDVARQGLTDASWPTHLLTRLLWTPWFFQQLEVPFFNHPLDQLIEHLFELRAFILAVIFGEHLLDLILTEQTLIDQDLQQSRAQRVKRSIDLLAAAGPIVIIVVSRLEQRV